ncbi:MAG: sigma-E processing peptidase SpoIIGA [Clostridia bacterium]|nr:sigma-E processing peptidase SpoIIGA [Clostridia bacterium]MDD4686155.1 sigma-E processing peptidase SpoIIGA [Clostridia bacterium]
MEVYIEDVILDNLVIDFLLLLITAKLLKINYKIILLIISAITGVVFTLLSLVININEYLMLLYKFLTAVIMVLVAFKFISFKKFFLQFLTFIFTTAIIGGLCFIVCFSFGKVNILNGIIYFNMSLPFGLIVGLIAFLSYFLLKIVEIIKIQSFNSNFVYSAILLENDKKINITAFMDTGNLLDDPLTGKPVNILTYNNFKKLFKEIPLHQLLLEVIPSGLKDAHYIKVSSVGKNSKMLVFYPEYLKIKQKNFSLVLNNPCIGLTFANLERKLSGNCGLILNPKTINNKFN